MTESTISSVTAVEDYSNITPETTDTTSWRPTDVKHKKNEVFVDVMETVNFYRNAGGDVLQAYVDGHIFMRAYLSGMPECKFVLNDIPGASASVKGAELYDCRFHQCVHSNEFNSAKTITFIPPDGEFHLMSYRCTLNAEPPIEVSASTCDLGTAGFWCGTTVKTKFDAKHSTSSLIVKIPTPLNATNVECDNSEGKVKYVAEENVIVWEIPTMQGGSRAALSALATLTPTPVKQVWSMSPIDVEFQLRGFTASGMSVNLKVTEKSNYDSARWVRYSAGANGSYQVWHVSSPSGGIGLVLGDYP